LEDEKEKGKKTPPVSEASRAGPTKVLSFGSSPIGNTETLSKLYEEGFRQASAELEKHYLEQAEKIISDVLQRMKHFMQGVIVGVVAGFFASISVALMEYYAVPIEVYWVIVIAALTFILVYFLMVRSKWYKEYVVRSMKIDQLISPVLVKSMMAIEHIFEEMDPERAEQIRKAAEKIVKERGMKIGKISMPPQSK
jgi:hypothetical protein